MKYILIIIFLCVMISNMFTNKNSNLDLYVNNIENKYITQKINENVNIVKTKNDFQTILEVSINNKSYGICKEEHLINAINKNDVFSNLKYNSSLNIIDIFCNEYLLLVTNNTDIKSLTDISKYTELKLGIEEYNELILFEIFNNANIYVKNTISNKNLINAVYETLDNSKDDSYYDLKFVAVKSYYDLSNYNIVSMNITNTPKNTYISFDDSINKNLLYRKYVLFNNL